MSERPEVATCLWFDSRGEDAARFYVSLLPDSAITSVVRPEPDGSALFVEFVLAGTPYQALNGGPQFVLDEAASIAVTTADQEETDRLWAALTADGGRESRCGWLVDRFGVSWQIVPARVRACLASADRAAAARAMAAVMPMGKIDVATVEAAFAAEDAD